MHSIFPVLGFALLLLLSPCKVRNFIEAELGLPQSAVLNKSQATISQSNCQTLEVSETIQTISKPTIQQVNLLTSEASCFEFTIHLLRHSFIPSPSRNQLVSEIPLYILHQNIQVYS